MSAGSDNRLTMVPAIGLYAATANESRMVGKVGVTASNITCAPLVGPGDRSLGEWSATDSELHAVSDQAAAQSRPDLLVRALTADEIQAAQAQLVEADDCPVPFDQLRMVEVPYWSFEATAEKGTLIVNADVAEALGQVFERLFDARFPIQRMDAIDPLPVDATSRVSSNNTVAFKCRAVRGGSSWSQHAYGHAVDINPVDNPSVSGGQATPPLGADRIDRQVDAPGMIHEGDVVTQAFDAHGWGWGGRWDFHQDYMHFSINGQ